jgi:hypothetical protein
MQIVGGEVDVSILGMNMICRVFASTCSPAKFFAAGLALYLLCLSTEMAYGRDWTDSTGNISLAGTLVAKDEKEIVIKLDQKEKGKELLAIPIDRLSESDQKYLASDEVTRQLQIDGDKHSWTLRSGLTVLAKVVDYGRKEVAIQRRRGKIYVNDRPFDSLPEFYRRMIPRVVEHFEKIKIEDEKAFIDWVLQLKGAQTTFKCEGVLLELPTGDEYAVPFFLFTDKDLRTLQPGWEKWQATNAMAEAERAEQQRQDSLYLQSQASAYQQQMQQEESMQIARLQLQLTAVAAGAIELWEVYLYPGPGVMAYPTSVVVYATNSDIAARTAMANNPGYVVGPIRKIAGRRF